MQQATHITLRWCGAKRKSFQVPIQAEVLSQRWSYVVWKRRRWRDDNVLVNNLAAKAVEDLGEFGIGPVDLDEIARCDVVEVGIPCGQLALYYMPWEFLLATATRARRDTRHLLVIRRLLDPPQQQPRQQTRDDADSAGLPLLFVQSGPGRLRGGYFFDTEYNLVRRALRLHSASAAASIQLIDTPTLEKLQEKISKLLPAIVHLSGIDSREGAAWVGYQASPGFYLQHTPSMPAPPTAANTQYPSCADPASRPAAESFDPNAAERLATGVDLGQACGLIPSLVSVNCFHSSTIAAEIVSHGAQFAIGFQDEVDNPLIELFFAHFYRDLLADGELQVNRVCRNFWKAFEAVRREKRTETGASGGSLRGTGIVLWTRAELELQRPRDSESDNLHEQRVTVPPMHDGGARSILEFDIRPFDRLNYSLLHNDRNLFKRFVIKTEKEGTVFDLHVQVGLDVAGVRHTYFTAIDLRDFYINLTRIRISLTSDLLRGLRENVYSSMHVKVLCQDQLVHEDTYRVLLLPINEWKDDRLNGAWLPSFVLPSDPAIQRVTRAARRYLQALTDDPLAGFDGYQRSTEKDCDSVHKQAQAVWNALLLDHRLSYINPPPSFEKQSQRIRTPSQIATQKRGTCIDLALLLAACLEEVDIYPALFLLTGHAFVGYFTSEQVHKEFGKLFQSYLAQPIPWSDRSGKPPQPWMLEKDARREIVQFVRDGALVPLETTYLCRNRGFFEAAQQGRRNLTDPSRFESIFDVKRARSANVVPLPIGGEKS